MKRTDELQSQGLKDIGYSELCTQYYDLKSQSRTNGMPLNWNAFRDEVSSPFLYEACEFILETHGIFIGLTPTIDHKMWFVSIFDFNNEELERKPELSSQDREIALSNALTECIERIKKRAIM